MHSVVLSMLKFVTKTTITLPLTSYFLNIFSALTIILFHQLLSSKHGLKSSMR